MENRKGKQEIEIKVNLVELVREREELLRRLRDIEKTLDILTRE